MPGKHEIIGSTSVNPSCLSQKYPKAPGLENFEDPFENTFMQKEGKNLAEMAQQTAEVRPTFCT